MHRLEDPRLSRSYQMLARRGFRENHAHEEHSENASNRPDSHHLRETPILDSFDDIRWDAIQAASLVDVSVFLSVQEAVIVGVQGFGFNLDS